MSSLRMQQMLQTKRDGQELSDEDLHWFAEQVALKKVEECQIGAMLMAICIRGLSQRETSALTRGMVNSGDTLEWDKSWVPVDKHSTGGVGDKVSLVLAPALASFGLKVPMISGRGLAHTGGTLDKLESIPGFRVLNTIEELQRALKDAGCFIAGASSNLAPADKILYAIRDVTATVDCIPLVVSSIISKKVAAGSKLLVMDIKVGKAAFFKEVDTAKKLARELIRVSKDLGVTTRIVLSKMDNPLGQGIGNALEVEDALQCMNGRGAPDLIEIVSATGAVILQERGIVSDLEEGKSAIRETLSNGKALECFHNMIICQGVDKEKAKLLCEGSTILPSVPSHQITPMIISKKGTITNMNALELGIAVWKLGAGRSSPNQDIDYKVGMWLTHKVGDKVDVGDVWAEVHHATPELDSEIKKKIEDSITVEQKEADINTSIVIEIM